MIGKDYKKQVQVLEDILKSVVTVYYTLSAYVEGDDEINKQLDKLDNDLYASIQYKLLFKHHRPGIDFTFIKDRVFIREEGFSYSENLFDKNKE